jgi:hypothetical protein
LGFRVQGLVLSTHNMWYCTCTAAGDVSVSLRRAGHGQTGDTPSPAHTHLDDARLRQEKWICVCVWGGVCVCVCVCNRSILT